MDKETFQTEVWTHRLSASVVARIERKGDEVAKLTIMRDRSPGLFSAQLVGAEICELVDLINAFRDTPR